MFMPCLCLRHGTYFNSRSTVLPYLYTIGLGFSQINEDALVPLRNDVLAQMTPPNSN